MSKSADKAGRLAKDGCCKVKVLHQECGESILLKLGFTKARVYFLLRLMAAFLDYDHEYNKVDALMGIDSGTSRAFTRVIDIVKISLWLRNKHEYTIEHGQCRMASGKRASVVVFRDNKLRRTFTQRLRRNLALFLLSCIEAAQYLSDEIQQINSRVAVIPVSTFNMKGTVQNNAYKHFLEGVFSKLGCNLYLLQELLWVVTSKIWVGNSKIWTGRIFPDCAIDIRATRREAGVVINGAGIAVRSLDMVDFDNKYLRGRICCCRIIVPRTFKVQTHLFLGKRRSRLVCVKDSSEYLHFLSFSFHGHHKIRKECKESNIKTFIEHVRECCERERLPAIIGGDFNYDIRNIRWEKEDHIEIYSPRRPAIDFLCTVHEDTFATKMTLVPEFARCQDITENVPEELKGKITNHLPLVGFIMIYDTPGVSEKGLALKL